MRSPNWLFGLALLLATGTAAAEQAIHVVQDGQSLGRIAKRYGVSVDAVCRANHISRRDPIKPGQKLLIPDDKDEKNSKPDAAVTESDSDSKADSPDSDNSDDKKSDDKKSDDKKSDDKKSEPAPAADEKKIDDVRLPGGLRLLTLPGGNRAYYYEPTGAGRHSLKPVIVYLHGRGGQPDKDCARWASIARPLGWLVCPVGPIEHGAGRAWNNNWTLAHAITMQTIAGLRDRYGRRVQLWGNTLIGFSEGAYAAMNVGVREPRTFNRWLILAANSTYWGGPGLEALGTARERVRRVYLITGIHDEVVEGTHQVEAWLRHAGVTTRVTVPDDMGHEVPLERKPGLYIEALRWLDRGPSSKKTTAGATASR